VIAIVNVTKEHDPVGLNDYELRINREVIAKFSHVRSEGLGMCLRLAALAADEAEVQRKLRLYSYNEG